MLWVMTDLRNRPAIGALKSRDGKGTQRLTVAVSTWSVVKKPGGRPSGLVKAWAQSGKTITAQSSRKVATSHAYAALGSLSRGELRRRTRF
jgi:hypothetical protein